MDKADIAGLKIDRLTKKELLDILRQRIKGAQKTFIVTPYSEFLYRGLRDPKLLEIFNQADFSVADGIGIFWAKRFLDLPLTAKTFWGKVIQSLWQLAYSLAAVVFYPQWIKTALPEKIVGADLIWDLAELAAKNNLSIYLLGGFGDTPKVASEKLRSFMAAVCKNCGRSFCKQGIGWSNKNPGDSSVIDDINEQKPDILLVAYGPIKQEQWIVENLPKLDVKLAVGLGGTFDYVAGKKSLPPKIIRYAGLEWLWRLFTQPRRIKRIFNATFGLMSGLWHYKVFMSLPFRPNVVSIILNPKNQVLIGLRNPHDKDLRAVGDGDAVKFKNYWQFPQGGIDPNEDLIRAAKREIFEELKITNIRHLKTSQHLHSYLYKQAMRPFINKFKYKGQRQQIVYFKFIGSDNEIRVDNEEFIDNKWADAEKLEKELHPEKLVLANIVVQDLKEMREKAII